MATLTGQKVKDAYQSLLKLESGTLTTSNKIVEDGAGNDSALSLSTTDVQVNGTLNFGIAPNASTTELTVLLVDGSTGDVVSRELDASAFSGGSVSVASPIVLSSGDVTIDDAGNLSALTLATAASDDKFLIWDESASVWKQISYSQIGGSAGGGTTNMLVARAKAISPVTSGSFSTVTFNDVADVPGAADSIFIGQGQNYLAIESTTLSNDTISALEAGTYHIDVSICYTVGTNNTVITGRIYDLTGAASLISSVETVGVGEHVMSYFHVVTIDSANRYQLQVQSSNGETALCNKTQVTITKLL